jgi:hypothetical protein
MEAKPGMVAIFILVNGEWRQHGDALPAGHGFIAQEIAYLRDALGVTATTFRKL